MKFDKRYPLKLFQGASLFVTLFLCFQVVNLESPKAFAQVETTGGSGPEVGSTNPCIPGGNQVNAPGGFQGLRSNGSTPCLPFPFPMGEYYDLLSLPDGDDNSPPCDQPPCDDNSPPCDQPPCDDVPPPGPPRCPHTAQDSFPFGMCDRTPGQSGGSPHSAAPDMLYGPVSEPEACCCCPFNGQRWREDTGELIAVGGNIAVAREPDGRCPCGDCPEQRQCGDACCAVGEICENDTCTPPQPQSEPDLLIRQ